MSRVEPGCPLCTEQGGVLIHRDDFARIVAVDEPDYPGFIRVIVAAHVREMTDLAGPERARLMAWVWAVEAAQREVLAPLKVNLASLGNVVPHLHWHLIPRAADDAHFPQPIWGTRQREPDAARVARWAALAPTLADAIRRNIAAG